MSAADEERLIKKRKLDDEHTKVESDSDDEDLPSYMINPKLNIKSDSQHNDHLYFDTINRSLLDFDFEKTCLISLLTINVYCCLVCGKYFQGRSTSSHAYNHSINEDHHIFINLDSLKIYILPDNYEVTNPKVLKSVADIKLSINPVYDFDSIRKLSTSNENILSYDLNKKTYDVGFIGLNNISNNDYSNVCLQLLSHIDEIRDFYLGLSQKESLNESIKKKSELNDKFGLFIRKLWSSNLYKNHISPHELLQFISISSKKKFTVTTKRLPKAFLVWLLNQLHLQLIKATKKKITIISEVLQGNIQITTTKLLEKSNDETKKVDFKVDEESKSINSLKFWILSLALPPIPLFNAYSDTDNNGNSSREIPQITIFELLKKYDGQTDTQVSSTELKKFQLQNPLPPYLLLHIDRGLEDDETKRGNPTVVKFPDVINFAPYVVGNGKDVQQNYKLIGNIKHELIYGEKLNHSDDNHEWSISLPKLDHSWISIHDLKIDNCQRELMFLEESYIQIWQRC